MLTSFFGNSKTTNYILLAAALPFVLGLRWWASGTGLPSMVQALGLIGQSGLLIFALLLLDFIIRKNKLTQPNTFGLWWFFCGITAAVELGNWAQSLVLVFSLLALRRIMSMATEQNLEKKIFDAALWILMISLFYPWFLWMILPLYIALTQLNQTAWRFYLIPLFSGLCLGLIYSAALIFFPEIGGAFGEALPLFSLKFAPIYWSWPKILWLQLALGAGLLLLITTLVRLPLAYKEGTTIRQAHFQWIWRVLIMAMVIAGFTSDQKVEVYIWLILPLTSVLYANILELRQPALLRELLALLPLVLPLTQLLLK
jgi:hypothetical protein